MQSCGLRWENKLSLWAPDWCVPHNRPASRVDNFPFLFLFPLNLDKRFTVIFFRLLSIKAVKYHPRRTGTALRQAFAKPQLCHDQTMILCLWNPIGKTYVMLNLREMSHTFKQVFWLCTFLPPSFQKETEVGALFGGGKRKSFHRQFSSPERWQMRGAMFCFPVLEQVRNGGKRSPLGLDKARSLPLSPSFLSSSTEHYFFLNVFLTPVLQTGHEYLAILSPSLTDILTVARNYLWCVPVKNNTDFPVCLKATELKLQLQRTKWSVF